MSKNLISLCAITKDSAAYINEMLRSVRELVEEAIVVDTGSTDNTKELARLAGAKVFDFTWVDDFSAARNYSLSLATSKWIIVLDTDETLDANFYPAIRAMVEQADRCYYLKRQHYTSSLSTSHVQLLPDTHHARQFGARGFYTTNDIRLFPNDPAIKFEGEVHETVEESILRSGRYKIVESDVVIHHYGPLESAAARERKSLFYLELARKKTAGAPGDWRTWYQLGIQYQEREDFDSAISSFRKCIELDAGIARLWRELGISFESKGMHLEAIDALYKAISIDSTCPSSWNALGVALLELGHRDEAAVSFDTALKINPHFLVAALNQKRMQGSDR